MATVWTAPAAGAAPTVLEPSSHLCSDLWNAGNGVVADVTIEGDVVVDALGCTLRRVVLHGDLVVPAGTAVTGDRVGVAGNVRASGSVTLTGGGDVASYVVGDVFLDGTADARLELSTTNVLGTLVGRTGDALLERTSVSGRYDVAVDDVTRIRGDSRLFGATTVRGGRVLVHDARFYRDLTLDGTGDVLVCRTEVDLDLLVTHLTDYARIGVEVPYTCTTRVHGSVVLVENPHSVDLGALEIDHHLVCIDNEGPRGITRTPGTVVRGSEYGDCTAR